MFGPPLEMFHCGGTAIVFDVTGHDEYILHNKNGLVVPTGNENQVIRYINKLKDNPTFLKKLKENALKTSAAWPDWNQASAGFYMEVKNILNNNNNNTKDIQIKTQFFMKWFEEHNNLFTESQKPYNQHIKKIIKLLNKYTWLKKILNNLFNLFHF